MPVTYEWKTTRGGRRFVRSVTPEQRVTVWVAAAPVIQVPYVVEDDSEPEAVLEAVEEAPKPKRGRPRKVVTDG